MRQTIVKISFLGNGTLRHNWADHFADREDYAGPAFADRIVDTSDQGMGLSAPYQANGADFANAMVFECAFQYADYFGDVGFDKSSDLVPLAQVFDTISWHEVCTSF